MGEMDNRSDVPPPRPAGPMGGAKGPVFTPAEQLQQLQFCIHSNPSWPELVALAFQHYIVMLGSTVFFTSLIVPAMGGDNGDKARVIQVLLFMSGINTLLQTFLGSRLPVVMGPSFAFVVSVLSTTNGYSGRDFPSGHERFVYTIRTVQGSLMACSFIVMFIGASRAWENLTRFFTPVIVAPFVTVLGLGVFSRGFPQLARCVEIGLPTLLLMVLSQYAKNAVPRSRTVLERFGVVICIAVTWAFAAVLTLSGAYGHSRGVTQHSCRTDRSYLMSSAPWIKVPYPFQWGPPVFKASAVFGMIGAVLVASAESTGAFYAAARLSGATPPPANVLTRSIFVQGVSTLLDGIFGSVMGGSVVIENVGLLGLTHVGSRRVVQMSTVFMIGFSIFGKFGAFFASVPLPIFAGVFCVLFGIVSAIGVSFLQFVNNNSMRNVYVVGLSLFLAVSVQQYFMMYGVSSGLGPVDTDAGWFNGILNTVFSSAATVAMIVGTVLDNTLDVVGGGGGERSLAADRGVPWWVPFQHGKGDSRNEEFYDLPLRIHDYLPPRLITVNFRR